MHSSRQYPCKHNLPCIDCIHLYNISTSTIITLFANNSIGTGSSFSKTTFCLTSFSHWNNKPELRHHTSINTVESPRKGHFGTTHFVPSRGTSFWKLKHISVLCREVVPFFLGGSKVLIIIIKYKYNTYTIDTIIIHLYYYSNKNNETFGTDSNVVCLEKTGTDYE